ncbi:MAG: VCBS repeat-containing protein [Phycisphaeraceae bacterium]|nr:VCBS repeat-containing protein [Phycisphaeraceae bacterium]
MKKLYGAIPILAAAGFIAPAHGQAWVTFVNQTSTRMPTSLNNPSLSTADVEEKDYAWGDVDGDGDLDLVNVRKQPFTSTGKKVNVLFMNEGTAEGHSINGVLVDRTSLYATESSIGGDQGFNTPTNDRDVILVDVDMDGWLDIVTATTLTDNQAKHLSHPRIYMNKGLVSGSWAGFRYEDARIPLMHPTAGPRFCSVSGGDLTGNGYPDLYFGDYDSGGAQIFDYNNKLLINDGAGFFTDQSESRLTSEMRLAAFGAASVIADMNGNGVLDVVKQTSLNAPTHVAITYNNPNNPGFFNDYHTIYNNAPYFVYVGDLNNNGAMDILVIDDGTDRVMFQTGVVNGRAQWTTKTLPATTNGFGGNALIIDLNNDGFQDLIITDVDVDIPGCSRRTQIYRNLGNGAAPDFSEIGEVIPFNMSSGVHDIAAFDIDGDGWIDMVVGRCSTTEVYVNQPPAGVNTTYPQGIPGFIEPGTPKEFLIQFTPIGAVQLVPGTGRLYTAMPGDPFSFTMMEDLGGNLYRGTLPAVDCPEQIRFYVTVQATNGATFRDPRTAPGTTYVARAAEGTEIAIRVEVDGDVSDWTVYSSNLTAGAWEAAIPNGTINNGVFAAPPSDASSAGSSYAFVTENGPPGGAAGANDVDGGPTYLESPTFSLEGTDGIVSYSRWFYCSTAGQSTEDFLWVEISNNNGASWTEVTAHRTGGTSSAWEDVFFTVGDWIAPTAAMKVRFVTSDNPNNSVTEAGIDNFQVEIFVCGEKAPCIGDLDDSGAVEFNDVLQLLAAWGPCGGKGGCPADLDGSGTVEFGDLLILLAAWGPCD